MHFFPLWLPLCERLRAGKHIRWLLSAHAQTPNKEKQRKILESRDLGSTGQCTHGGENLLDSRPPLIWLKNATVEIILVEGMSEWNSRNVKLFRNLSEGRFCCINVLGPNKFRPFWHFRSFYSALLVRTMRGHRDLCIQCFCMISCHWNNLDSLLISVIWLLIICEDDQLVDGGERERLEDHLEAEQLRRWQLSGQA